MKTMTLAAPAAPSRGADAAYSQGGSVGYQEVSQEDRMSLLSAYRIAWASAKNDGPQH
jgi:hypothetical protein